MGFSLSRAFKRTTRAVKKTVSDPLGALESGTKELVDTGAKVATLGQADGADLVKTFTLGALDLDPQLPGQKLAEDVEEARQVTQEIQKRGAEIALFQGEAPTLDLSGGARPTSAGRAATRGRLRIGRTGISGMIQRALGIGV